MEKERQGKSYRGDVTEPVTDQVAGQASNLCAGSAPDDWHEQYQLRRLEQALDRLRYSKPRPDQVPKYQALRDAAAAFATVIVRNTPETTESITALSTLELALMLANKSIALGT